MVGIVSSHEIPWCFYTSEFGSRGHKNLSALVRLDFVSLVLTYFTLIVNFSFIQLSLDSDHKCSDYQPLPGKNNQLLSEAGEQ